MFRYLTSRGLLRHGSATLGAQNKEQGRLENCGVVMQEVLDIPDNIPQELLEKAECVIVIPSMTKVAIGIGGSYGRGAMVCRTGATFNGPWGAPAMYSLEGGSFGSAARRRIDRRRAAGDEQPRRGRAAQQQGQARRQRVGGGRPQGPQRSRRRPTPPCAPRF